MSPSAPPVSTKRILICSRGLSVHVEDKVQMGIRRFALNHPDWRIGYLYASQVEATHLKEVLDWKPDGILVVTKPTDVPKLFELEEIPTVVTNHHHELVTGVSSVKPDNLAIGRRAADYFLRNRLPHFGIVLWPGNPPFSQLREEGFVKRLWEEKRETDRFEVQRTSNQPWYRNTELEVWLKNLPKPVGVFCVNDVTAMRVLEYCDQLNIRVPSEISLVGTDNHELICETVRPNLSSIPQPLGQVGYRAAEILDSQIDLQRAGASVSAVHEVIGPGEIVERQSSNVRVVPDSNISQAVNYLQDHTLKGCAIGDAAQEAGLNRRAMERGFKKHLGVTPGGFMREIKIAHAKKLLTETDLRMSEIAEACLMTQEHFATSFREDTGQTPSEYRRKTKRLGN